MLSSYLIIDIHLHLKIDIYQMRPPTVTGVGVLCSAVPLERGARDPHSCDLGGSQHWDPSNQTLITYPVNK